MTQWRNLPPAQQKVLARLRRGPGCAHTLECSVSTIAALSRKKLVYVDTTFDNIAFPRSAFARITDDGRKLLADGEAHP